MKPILRPLRHVPVRLSLATALLAALLAGAPATGRAADEAPGPDGETTPKATSIAPEAALATPAPAPTPEAAGLDSAIPASSSLGDCWVKCATIDPFWLYGVTYEECCGQGHSCPDGSIGYARGFYPYQGIAVRCTA